MFCGGAGAFKVLHYVLASGQAQEEILCTIMCKGTGMNKLMPIYPFHITSVEHENAIIQFDMDHE